MKRSPINKVSKKRQAEIASGLRTANGALKMTAAQYLTMKAANKPSKSTGRAKAMKAADRWFSEWIRLRDSDENGMAYCVTSKKQVRRHWRDMDCGHWISRAKQATRYDERNAHAQGGQANRFQGGHFLEHGLAIDRIHGPGTREALELKAMQDCKRTADDFQRIADDYHARILVIRDREPMKYHRQQ
jgi:hypothetical protein